MNNLGFDGGEDQQEDQGYDEQQDDGTWDLNQASGRVVDAVGDVLKCLMVKEPTTWKTQNRSDALQEDDDVLDLDFAGPTPSEAQSSTPCRTLKLCGAFATPLKSECCNGAHGEVKKKKFVKCSEKVNINFLGANSKPPTSTQAPTVLLNALGTERPGYKLVEGIVDSGAAKSTCGVDVFPGEARPSEISKLGSAFSGPAGEEIPNLGEQDALWESDEGSHCKMVIQLSDVDRVLLSGTELADNGFEVILRKRDGFIKNLHTGKTIKLIRKGYLEQKGGYQL